MKFIKQGAMFGLDARIALAIFGALSVISGAALYSAVQEAKVISILAEMKEFEKAYEQFMLDTAQDLPNHNVIERKVEFLLYDTGFTGVNWQGPYIGLSDSESTAIDGRIVYPNGTNNTKWMVRTYTANTSWSEGSSTEECKAGGSICYNWLMREGALNRAIVEAIDLKVDGVVDFTQGNLRAKTWAGPPEDFTMYMKMNKTLNSPLR